MVSDKSKAPAPSFNPFRQLRALVAKAALFGAANGAVIAVLFSNPTNLLAWVIGLVLIGCTFSMMLTALGKYFAFLISTRDDILRLQAEKLVSSLGDKFPDMAKRIQELLNQGECDGNCDECEVDHLKEMSRDGVVKIGDDMAVVLAPSAEEAVRKYNESVKDTPTPSTDTAPPTETGSHCESACTSPECGCSTTVGTKPSDVRADTVTERCHATSMRTGNRCRNKATNGGRYCNIHKKQEE